MKHATHPDVARVIGIHKVPQRVEDGQGDDNPDGEVEACEGLHELISSEYAARLDALFVDPYESAVEPLELVRHLLSDLG